MIATLLQNWQIADFVPGEGSGDDDGTWLPVEAPADTFLALHAAGRIPHPFAPDGEKACAWVKDREWWWRTEFAAPPTAAGERVELVFEGLDTFATIWLNGVEIGSTANMFLEWRFDIGALLRHDCANRLAVRFTPTATMVAGREVEAWPIIGDPIHLSKRTLIRKAQFGWGWDWAPALPTVGIWKPVRLERHRDAAIRDLRFETLAIGRTARVAATVEIETFGSSRPRCTVTLVDPAGNPVVSGHPDEAGRIEFTIDEPRLWWTADLGEPTLYTLTAALENGQSRQRRVGIRTVALDQSPDPDEPGATFFRFVLNGTPIFARGANWIPASSFPAAVDEATYRDLLGRASVAHMNMVRVWGGGIYEHDAFYETCDRLGLLVWQDFMFACAPYPEEPGDFVASVRAEVTHQVRRLRNHPCLACWCGNNEGDAVQDFVNRMNGRADRFSGDLYIHGIIPEILAALDPATPYRPGSPNGEPSANSMKSGDVHNWTVWHGLPPIPDAEPVGAMDLSPDGVAFTRYAEDRSRFVSEFGIQAAPALETWRRWGVPETTALDDALFLDRIKDHPKDKVFAMLASVTPTPNDLSTYVDYTQALQAEGLAFGIAHYRRRKPHNSGTLIWQFNDCWPGVSWSLIDGDGVAKPSWYAVARAYAPLAASFRACGEEDEAELWVSNDTSEAIALAVDLALSTLAGEVLWHRKVEVVAPANASVAVERFRVDGAPNRVLTARSARFPDARHFFAPLKDVPFAGALDGSIVPCEGGVDVRLRARGYCPFVTLTTPDPRARFTDNAFDLADGECRTISVVGGGQDGAGLVVRSLLQRTLTPALTLAERSLVK